jgi:hypothetical protein
MHTGIVERRAKGVDRGLRWHQIGVAGTKVDNVDAAGGELALPLGNAGLEIRRELGEAGSGERQAKEKGKGK